MLKTLLYSKENWTQTILRIALGIVIRPHGAQKLLGWFGGPGFSGAIDHLMIDFGLPWIVAFLVIMIEFFGPTAAFGRIANKNKRTFNLRFISGDYFCSSPRAGIFHELVWTDGRRPRRI